MSEWRTLEVQHVHHHLLRPVYSGHGTGPGQAAGFGDTFAARRETGVTKAGTGLSVDKKVVRAGGK